MFSTEILVLLIAQQDNTLTAECEFLEKTTAYCETLLDELTVTPAFSSKMNFVKQTEEQGILATIESDTLAMQIEMSALAN
jgi:hypothetical protein